MKGGNHRPLGAGSRIPPERRARIIKLLREGYTVTQTARMSHSACWTALCIAREEGIPYAKGQGGAKAGGNKPKPKPVLQVTVIDREHRGAAYNARWGYQLGGNWK